MNTEVRKLAVEHMNAAKARKAKQRLEHLRGELRAERISYGELAELQDLAAHIEPGDVELLEPAGVPEEYAYDAEALARWAKARRCPQCGLELTEQRVNKRQLEPDWLYCPDCDKDFDVAPTVKDT